MLKAFSALVLTTILALCIAEAPQWQDPGNRGGFHTVLRTRHRRPHVNVGDQQPRQDQPCNGHPMAGYPAAGFRPVQAFLLPTEAEQQDYRPALEYGPPPTPMISYGLPSINSYMAPAANGANDGEEARMTFKRDLSVDMDNEDVGKSAEEKVVEETLQQQSFDNDGGSDDSDITPDNDNAQLQQEEEGIQQQQQIEKFEIPLAYLQIPVQFIPIPRKQ